MQMPPFYRYADAFKDNRLRYILIGALGAAEDEHHLRHLGVTHVYSVMNHPLKPYCNGIVFRSWKVEDEVDVDIMLVARKVYRQLDVDRRVAGARILIHCRAGISRSASVVLYHLMRSWTMTFEDAYTLLKQIRPMVDPNPGFRRQLREWSDTARGTRYLCALEQYSKSIRDESTGPG